MLPLPLLQFQSFLTWDSLNMNMDMEVSTSFHDFLYRMRHPASLDLVRSIKRHIFTHFFQFLLLNFIACMVSLNLLIMHSFVIVFFPIKCNIIVFSKLSLISDELVLFFPPFLCFMLLLILTENCFISFIVSFSFHQPKPENDGKRVQDFFVSMEAAIRDHSLWTTASEEDIDCAMQVSSSNNCTYYSVWRSLGGY